MTPKPNGKASNGPVIRPFCVSSRQDMGHDQFWKRGEGGIFRGEPRPEIPPAPFNKGGAKFTGGEFMQPCLECFLPNKNGAAEAFMRNIFTLVELRIGVRPWPGTGFPQRLPIPILFFYLLSSDPALVSRSWSQQNNWCRQRNWISRVKVRPFLPLGW